MSGIGSIISILTFNRLTAARTTKLDNINATVTSRLTSTAISSIQYGTIDLGASPTTAGITSVSTARSIVFPLGQVFSSNDPRTAANLTLTNSTTVTATATSTSPANANIGFCVLEFK